MRALAATLAALTLAGCFSSEQPLFGDDDAVFPIMDSAIYDPRSSEQPDRFGKVRFTRVGEHYELQSIYGDDMPLRVMFAPVIQTPENDYIAQISMDGEPDSFLYWFVWPLGDGRYRIQLGAVEFDDTGQPTFDRCFQAFSGCRFDSADELRKHYLEVAYPLFSNGRRPASYVDMFPVEPTAAPTGE